MTEVVKAILTRAQKYAARIEVLTKRIAADTLALAETQQELETSERLSSVQAGTAIVARLGRAGSAAVEAKDAVLAEDGVTVVTPAVVAKAGTAGTLREVGARVVGVKEEDNGSLRYKIMFGEGIDLDVDVIQASQIVRIVDENGSVAA